MFSITLRFEIFYKLYIYITNLKLKGSNLRKVNKIDKTNKINKINEINQINKISKIDKNQVKSIKSIKLIKSIKPAKLKEFVLIMFLFSSDIFIYSNHMSVINGMINQWWLMN